MPGPDDGLGKKAEEKIKQWLNKPELNWSFDRIPDQMNGRYLTSRNICDFIYYRYPYQYYIESKATYHDRFDFSSFTDVQREGLFKKSQIAGCYGLGIILFATYQRAFVIDIRDVYDGSEFNPKSLNINKIDKWTIPFAEIQTIPSRKELLDYEGCLYDYVDSLVIQRSKVLT